MRCFPWELEMPGCWKELCSRPFPAAERSWSCLSETPPAKRQPVVLLGLLPAGPVAAGSQTGAAAAARLPAAVNLRPFWCRSAEAHGRERGKTG